MLSLAYKKLEEQLVTTGQQLVRHSLSLNELSPFLEPITNLRLQVEQSHVVFMLTSLFTDDSIDLG